MRRNKPLSPREHLTLGAELCDIDNQLTVVWFALESAYGRPGGDRAHSVQKRLSALRSWLDDKVCTELPRSVDAIEGVPITRAYYNWHFGPRGDGDFFDTETARCRLTERACHLFDDSGNPWIADYK